MSFVIKTTSYFDAEAKRLKKRYRSLADDLARFEESITSNPYQGTELAPGIRKVRLSIASKGKGQSGGARVITFIYSTTKTDGTITLLLLYDKADASNIKINIVKKIVKELDFDEYRQ